MSRLYWLPIEGAGTAHVEALSSYLLRLAHLHAVTPGALITAVAEQWGAFSLKAMLACPISVLIRPNATTQVWVDALARAFGGESAALESMTYLALSEALHRPMKTFSPHLRWCSACLREQVQAGSPVHYQLLWQLSMLSACPVHRVKLRDRCPSCHRTQEGHGMHADLSRCFHCEQPLDVIFPTDLTNAPQHSQLVELVEAIATGGSRRFPAGGIATVVSRLLDEAWAAGTEHELYRTLRRDDCIRFSNPKEPVTLLWALRIAHRLQIPLVDLLNGTVTGVTHSILPPQDDFFPGALAPAARQRLAPDTLRSGLKELLDTTAAFAAPSLRGVATTLGVSTGALRYWCDEGSQQVIQRRCRAVQEDRKRVHRQSRHEVARLVDEWPRLGKGPLTKKGALAELRSRTALPKNLLRAEIDRRLRCGTVADSEVAP